MTKDKPPQRFLHLTATIMCAAWTAYGIQHAVHMKEFDEDGHVFMGLIIITLAEIAFRLWTKPTEDNDNDDDESGGGPMRMA